MALEGLLKRSATASLSDQERHRLATAMATDVLPTIDGVVQRFELVLILRRLTGQAFGYSPFSNDQDNATSVQAWIDWASGNSGAMPVEATPR